MTRAKARESNPATELQDRFRAMNAPVLGGDFADWCRANSVGVGGVIEITWSAGELGIGNTVQFRVTALGERKILGVRADEDYGETVLSAEGHPIHSICRVGAGSQARP